MPNVDTSELARLFQAAMQEFRTSSVVFDPRTIIVQFIEETMPHIGVKRALNTYRETDEFLINLAGFEVINPNHPEVPEHQTFPNLAFKSFQASF